LVDEGFPTDQIDVIPNMLELPEACSQTSLGNHIGFAGRLSPEKGVEVLFEAARLCAAIPFEVAGRTEKMPLAASLAPDNVHLQGHLDSEKLESFNRNARILVVPSLWYEGFPGVLLEAMLQGKPVICSRIGGLPEIVDDGKTGLLFEPGNAAELADKIKYLWDRPELCQEMGKAGRDKVLTEYNSDRYYERLMRTYEQAMSICQV
jgi:glycosyltransferase involved in cell wall biosynthesis